MKKSALVIALAALGCLSEQAMAQQNPWLVRVRAVHISPADKSDPIGGVGAADTIHVSEKTIPEVDISYFFTSNWAAELVLTYPQKHDVTLNGANIGSFKHLPPTLTVQYHFTPASAVSPYVGAGVNYTRISSVDLLNGAGKLDNSSVGLALQVGVNFKLDKNWSLNLDVKKIQLRSDVSVSGTRVSTLRIDPWLVGVGVGYRF